MSITLGDFDHLYKVTLSLEKSKVSVAPLARSSSLLSSFNSKSILHQYLLNV